MSSPENTSGSISEELFDRFRSSEWPNMFGHMALAAREQGKPLGDTLKVHETGLIIAPQEEVKMLRDIGVVEETFPRASGVPIPHFTEFGKEVIAACEGLFTPEEYAAQNEAAGPELERMIAETEAELGILGQE